MAECWDRAQKQKAAAAALAGVAGAPELAADSAETAKLGAEVALVCRCRGMGAEMVPCYIQCCARPDEAEAAKADAMVLQVAALN